MNAERKNLRSVFMCAVVSKIILSSKKIFSCGRLFITLYGIMTRKSIYVDNTIQNYVGIYIKN